MWKIENRLGCTLVVKSFLWSDDILPGYVYETDRGNITTGGDFEIELSVPRDGDATPGFLLSTKVHKTKDTVIVVGLSVSPGSPGGLKWLVHIRDNEGRDERPQIALAPWTCRGCIGGGGKQM